MAEARLTSMREREAAVAAAVTAKSLELRAAKAVEDKANAERTAALKVGGR